MVSGVLEPARGAREVESVIPADSRFRLFLSIRYGKAPPAARYLLAPAYLHDPLFVPLGRPATYAPADRCRVFAPGLAIKAGADH